jgi:uncharacterized protein DUF5710
MIYLEITYAQKDDAKPFGVRWDPKEKLWYFPGDVLPQELERFRPANAPKGAVEKIILDIPFSYRDTAARAGVRWDSEIKACFFEKRRSVPYCSGAEIYSAQTPPACSR